AAAGEQQDRAYAGAPRNVARRHHRSTTYPSLRLPPSRGSLPREALVRGARRQGAADAAHARASRGLRMGDAIVTVAEQSLHLLPERAVLWEEANTLIVADTHWGKAATFRAAGLPVPSGTAAEGLERLSSALKRSGANRLVFLGDLL